MVAAGAEILPHALAVQVPAALAEVIVALLDPDTVRVDVAEVAEAAAPEQHEALVFRLVGMPVGDIVPEGIDDDVRTLDERGDAFLPLAVVRLQVAHGDLAVIAVAPAVGSKFPAVRTQRPCDLRDLLFIFLDIRVYAFIGGIRAVSEHTVVAGDCDDCLGSAVGEVRMLVDEIVQNGDQVVGADVGGAVFIIPLGGDPSVLTDDQAA